LAPTFHRLTVAEMLEDLERIRRVVGDTFGATMITSWPGGGTMRP